MTDSRATPTRGDASEKGTVSWEAWSATDASGRTRVNWPAMSVLIAAAALAAALVFNGLQLRNSASATREARQATELGLLTQLHTALDTSIYRRVPYARQFQEL